MTAQAKSDVETLDDQALARRAALRDPDAIRLVTIRHNQRLFRTAWSILGHRSEAEDVLQNAYLKAFAAIHGFEGRASLSTWLTRIVINEALDRRRSIRRRRTRMEQARVAVLDDYRENLMQASRNGSPDAELARAELRKRLEQAISDLPLAFRLVFVMREVDGLSVEEIAQALSVGPATVRTRSLRARRRLQKALEPELQTLLSGTFPFAGVDCARMSDAVVRSACAEADPESARKHE